MTTARRGQETLVTQPSLPTRCEAGDHIALLVTRVAAA